jgi:hypothetical protein
MKTVLTITVPELKAITRALSSDWGPTIHATARRLGVAVALAWTLCSMAADRWQQLVGWAQRHHIHGLSRLGLPGGAYLAADQFPAATKMVTQRQASATTPANIAPPVSSHIINPMIRAIRLVRVEGRSQRLAASICGVSRSSLQRALKE